MDVRYIVEEAADGHGWRVMSNGVAQALCRDQAEALQIGRFLTTRARAAGNGAVLMLREEGRSVEVAFP